MAKGTKKSVTEAVSAELKSKFNLNNFKDKKGYYFIIFQNFSLKMEAANTFGTRLTIDGKPQDVTFLVKILEYIFNYWKGSRSR